MAVPFQSTIIGNLFFAQILLTKKPIKMKTLKTAVAALLIAGGAIGAFAFTKANTEKASDKKADLYWFDAGTNQYIGHSENSGCDNSDETLCAVGYNSVANPSNPQKPNTTPDDTANGVRPD
jgi:hypothetical protein